MRFIFSEIVHPAEKILKTFILDPKTTSMPPSTPSTLDFIVTLAMKEQPRITKIAKIFISTDKGSFKPFIRVANIKPELSD